MPWHKQRGQAARGVGYTDDRNFPQVVQKARTACLKSVHRDEDHFVDVNEMVHIGRESAWWGRWCLAGDESVGGEGDFFRFTEKRGVEELEEASEAEQWVRASFGGEGDGGSPFEDFAVFVGELQDFLHEHQRCVTR